jgi:hypothetical protein
MSIPPLDRSGNHPGGFACRLDGYAAVSQYIGLTCRPKHAYRARQDDAAWSPISAAVFPLRLPCLFFPSHASVIAWFKTRFNFSNLWLAEFPVDTDPRVYGFFPWFAGYWVS